MKKVKRKVATKNKNTKKKNSVKAIKISGKKVTNNVKAVSAKLKNKLKKNRGKAKAKHPILITLMYALIGIFGAIVAFILLIIVSAPSFKEDNLYNKEATIIYDKYGKEYAKIGLEKRELVTYDELPQVLIDAIIATEDSRFIQHNGFDIARFTKAAIGQLKGNSGAGGGSTLTMQVAKNNFTDANATTGIKGIIRKFTDIYIAVFKIEKNYTKEQIIEFYVNAPWLGNNSYGVEQASQTYFGKSVKDLSLNEAAIIAGMFNAPASYNPFNSIELTTKRRNQVLNLMVRHGYLNEEEAAFAKEVSIESLLTEKITNNSKQAFIDTVIEEIKTRTPERINGYVTPLLIYSTVDPEKQEYVSKIMDGSAYKFPNDVVQAGVAVTDVNDGSIVAIGAGRNRVGELKYNYATMIKRHPGSTAKPIFDYGPLFEYRDASTYTPFFDEKYTYRNGTSMNNADRKYHGLLTLRESLSLSRNIPALRAFHLLEEKEIAEFAHNLHIDYGDTLYEASAVGGFDGVSPLTMSAAYAAFARDGYYIEPYSYTKFEIRETEEVIEYKPIKEKAMSKETAYLITDVLQDAIKIGIGGVSVSGTDVAGKTGTSTIDGTVLQKKGISLSAIRDSWVVQYSPDYAIALWYGYDEISKDYYLTSGTASKVRKAVSQYLGKNIYNKNSKFEKPKGIVEAEVELQTFPAQLASPFTPEDLKRTELFRKGTEPERVSDRFNTLNNPTNLKGNYSAVGITITWDPIAIPNAINTTYLTEYFNKYYDKYVEKYYNERITYNTNFMGTIGYQIYMKNTVTGALTPLAYTSNKTYTYLTTPTNTNYTFVVKSAYSIFKDNMSSGVEITINPYDESTQVTFNFNEKTTEIISSSGTYQDPATPFKTFVNGVEINGYTFTREYYKVENSGEVKITSIPLNTKGTYKIYYIVTLTNGKKYNPSRTIIVK